MYNKKKKKILNYKYLPYLFLVMIYGILYVR